jgi:hypothetical protein
MHALLRALWLLLACLPAQAAEPIVYDNVVLLQPSSVLEERVANIDAMAEYVKALQVAAREAVLASSVKQAVGGYIVVAVKPGGQSKVWLDFDTLLDQTLVQQLIAKTEGVPPFEARKGPVVFALKAVLWDGKPPKRIVPSPIEWRRAASGVPTMEVGELVEKVWPQ